MLETACCNFMSSYGFFLLVPRLACGLGFCVAQCALLVQDQQGARFCPFALLCCAPSRRVSSRRAFCPKPSRPVNDTPVASPCVRYRVLHVHLFSKPTSRCTASRNMGISSLRGLGCLASCQSRESSTANPEVKGFGGSWDGRYDTQSQRVLVQITEVVQGDAPSKP